MDWNDYQKRFEEEAQREGKPASFLVKHLAYAERLVRAELPIIFDFQHLSVLLGFDEFALRDAIRAPRLLYSSYFIPKRTTGYRRIDAPTPSLRQAQEWILAQILNRCSPHVVANGFCLGRSIKQNAEPHVGQQMVLKLDVKEFFSSISEMRVRRVFLDLGYSFDVAQALTGLTILNGGLPQGAPTSPALSNLVMVNVDEMLLRYATARSLRYTRYADDLTFSGTFRAGEIILAVRRALATCELSLNEHKTRLMLPHQQQEVTGVVVNMRVQAKRSLRRALRQEVHYIQKFGIDDHVQRTPSVYQDRLNHLRGLAEFVLFLNPDDRDARKAIDVLGRVRFVPRGTAGSKRPTGQRTPPDS